MTSISEAGSSEPVVTRPVGPPHRLAEWYLAHPSTDDGATQESEVGTKQHCACRSSAWQEAEVLRTRIEGLRRPRARRPLTDAVEKVDPNTDDM